MFWAQQRTKTATIIGLSFCAFAWHCFFPTDAATREGSLVPCLSIQDASAPFYWQASPSDRQLRPHYEIDTDAERLYARDVYWFDRGQAVVQVSQASRNNEALAAMLRAVTPSDKYEPRYLRDETGTATFFFPKVPCEAECLGAVIIGFNPDMTVHIIKYRKNLASGLGKWVAVGESGEPQSWEDWQTIFIGQNDDLVSVAYTTGWTHSLRWAFGASTSRAAFLTEGFELKEVYKQMVISCLKK